MPFTLANCCNLCGLCWGKLACAWVWRKRLWEKMLWSVCEQRGSWLQCWGCCGGWSHVQGQHWHKNTAWKGERDLWFGEVPHALQYNRQTWRCEGWYRAVGLMRQFCCRELSDQMLQQQEKVWWVKIGEKFKSEERCLSYPGHTEEGSGGAHGRAVWGVWTGHKQEESSKPSVRKEFGGGSGRGEGFVEGLLGWEHWDRWWNWLCGNTSGVCWELTEQLLPSRLSSVQNVLRLFFV